MFIYMNTSVSQLIASVRTNTHIYIKRPSGSKAHSFRHDEVTDRERERERKGTRMFGEYPNHPRKISKVSGKTFKFYVTKQDFTHTDTRTRHIIRREFIQFFALHKEPNDDDYSDDFGNDTRCILCVCAQQYTALWPR